MFGPTRIRVLHIPLAQKYKQDGCHTTNWSEGKENQNIYSASWLNFVEDTITL